MIAAEPLLVFGTRQWPSEVRAKHKFVLETGGALVGAASVRPDGGAEPEGAGS